jgi:ankyrin repeat protein
MIRKTRLPACFALAGSLAAGLLCGFAAGLLPAWAVAAKTPHQAAESGDLAALRKFAEQQVDIAGGLDSLGRTPLFYAVEGSQLPAIDYLIAQGADVHLRDKSGYTPLMVAAGAAGPKSFQAARALLRHGADPHARVRNPNPALGVGPSVLDLAASRGHVELVRLLLAKGATVVDPERPAALTALHWACLGNQGAKYRKLPGQRGNRQVIRLLVDASGSVNLIGGQKRTPLHVAAAEGVLDTLEFLVSAYATKIDVYARDADGNTPLHLAVRSQPLRNITPRRRAEAVRILRDHGAQSLANSRGQSPEELAGDNPVLLRALRAPRR